jgi:hypothetical protein
MQKVILTNYTYSTEFLEFVPSSCNKIAMSHFIEFQSASQHITNTGSIGYLFVDEWGVFVEE